MSGGLLCFINKWSKKKCIYSFLAFIIFFETGCQYMTEAKDKMVEDGNTCIASFEQLKKKSDIGSLNMIRNLYYRSCYDETIQAVEYARQKFRDSVVSLTKDAAETVVFEGTFIDYVMESYERTYLSLLAVRSYMQLRKYEEAKIELRKSYEESIANIDKRGQDRVTLFLMAGLWVELGIPENAEPIYRRIIELSKNNSDQLLLLATNELKVISKKRPHIFIFMK